MNNNKIAKVFDKLPHWPGLVIGQLFQLSDKVSARKDEVINVFFWNGKRFMLMTPEDYRKGGVIVLKRYVKDTTHWKEVGWHKSDDEAIAAIRGGTYNAECRDDKETAMEERALGGF